MYPDDTSIPVSISSFESGVIHIFYEPLEGFKKREKTNSGEHIVKPEIGDNLYYIGQTEGENLTFEEFQEIFNRRVIPCGLKIFSPPLPSTHQPKLLDHEPIEVTTQTEKPFNDLINELEIPNEVITSSELKTKLVFKLTDLKTALREEGDSLENRMVIEKTKTLIESTLQSGAPMEPSEYHKAITKYQQEVSNLSLSQKVLIATMMFLGALAGFIVGAVIGGVVSAGNPLVMLAAGFTTAVIVGTSIGTVAGGGLGLLLSRVGVFKYDPVKAAAKEFVESIDNYHSAKSNNFS